YGCDDCQLVCPWNSFAQVSDAPDFRVRNGLDDRELISLFAWTEQEFDTRLAGSAIRRIGHERWLRNLAVGLGNARRAAVGHTTAGEGASAEDIAQALQDAYDSADALVQEHIGWALQA
ncbi:MAG: tRNA epoxyqueuosine(34) reductase QueG, partial [Chitinophagaceae bacterium]|nr:tRNA epoxyqueuosine(34) reductase QueG [Rubrivivax sp.]